MLSCEDCPQGCHRVSLTMAGINSWSKRLYKDVRTLTLIRGKYGNGYKEVIAEQLRGIKGVVSIYFLLGDVDFVIYTVAKNKDEYSKILDKITSISEIERSDTRTILQTYREMDFSRIDI